MSFWEDRFVNRPHAGAVPPSPYTDSPYIETRGSAYPQLPSPDDQSAWGSETTSPADEVGDPVEAPAFEPAEAENEPGFTPTEDEPVQEYERKGLFRRRKPVLVDAVDDDEAEADEEPALEDGDDNSEKDVTEPEAWSVVTEPETEHEHGDEPVAPVEDAPKRGFFRRRKHEVVATELEHEQVGEDEIASDTEAETEPEPEAEPGHDAWHVPAGDEEHDEVAASAEASEAPDETPKRRGLFRRRKSEPVAEDGDTSVVEDESFENVPYWSSEVTSDADASDEVEQDSEPVSDEPEVFVFGENETVADDTTSESEPAEAAPDETTYVHELVAEASEEAPADESFATDDKAGDEVDAAHDEHATVPEVVSAHEPSFEPESAVDDLPVEEPAEEPLAVADDEPEVEPVAHDWHGADESAEVDEPEAEALHDEVVSAPLPLKRRNGGGSRGKKVVGLKVGASQIAAAVVAGNDDRPALVDVARRTLEQGVVVGGELRDPEALVRALKAFFKESHLPTKNVRLGLSSSRVGVRMFDIAGVEDETRFDNAVRFKAHEVLPVAAHESVLDYRVVEERYTESGEVSRRVLLVVAPRDQVEPYIDACREAGLRLAGVDLEAFGLLRTFVPPFGSRSRTEDSATVVVAIGHEASTLLVAGGGICEFTRVFEWGGGALQNAIADELEVPHMEAATILTHLSLDGPGRHLDSLDADMRSRALEAVRARLTPFARELVSSLQFYQTQPESLGIREILITGGTAHLEGLADSLHQMIGVNVSVGDPLARVNVQTDIPHALEATIGSLAVPIGLAIEDEAGRSVDLLPKESRQTRTRPSALKVAVPLAAALPLAALAFAFVQANGAAGDRRAELDAVRAQIDALPVPTRANIDPALAGEQASRATAVAQILGGRLTWERVLGDVSRVLPAGVSLRELTATAPPPSTPQIAATTTDGTTTDGSTPAVPPPAPVAAPTTSTGVTVTGYALDYATIARTLARLQAVPSLTNAELQSATPSLIGQKRIIEFTIVASLATPGGVQ